MFGSVVRANRKRLGLSQEELAERTGLSVRAIGKLETGKITTPHPATLRSLADIFGLRGAQRDRFCETAASVRPHNELTLPRQLPMDLAHFAGRARHLAQLDGMVESGTPQAQAASRIIVISGMAGAGKTTLAIHWAHRVADQFPDGQLYLNLRGFDPTGQIMQCEDAVRYFLDASQVPPDRIPSTAEGRIALYRSLVADRRMLVLLDNVRDVGQIRPLLPGTAGCTVLITSRHQLPGLLVTEGAHPVPLNLLTADEARDLLTARLGAARVTAEPPAVDAIIDRCARLPLALCVVASRAATRPTFPLAALAAELRHDRRRLDAFDAGDPSVDLRSVFAWSYEALTPTVARAFRLLALHPGPDLTVAAAASLAATSMTDARRLLAGLVGAHLLTEPAPGRYAFHDLLRSYATELTDDLPQQRHAAVARLLDFYLSTAAAAMDVLLPAEKQRRPQVPRTDPQVPLPNLDAARGWLEAERPNLVAVTTYAARHGWARHASNLAATIAQYLDAGARYTEALDVHTHALEAARGQGDSWGAADALFNLGVVYFTAGRYPESLDHFQQAVHLRAEIGDVAGQARTLGRIGVLLQRWGRHDEAAQHLRRSAAICGEVGDRAGEAIALGNLGTIVSEQGHYDDALGYYQQVQAIFGEIGHRGGEGTASDALASIHMRRGELDAAHEQFRRALAIHLQVGDRRGEGVTLDGLGWLYERSGQFAEAVDHHRRAAEIARALGIRVGEASSGIGIGKAFQRWGRYQEAIAEYRQALALAREIGERRYETGALNGLGETLRLTGRYAEAVDHHRQALKLARQTGDRMEQASALDGIGQGLLMLGRRDEARSAYEQALAQYTELDVPEADAVRDRLAELG